MAAAPFDKPVVLLLPYGAGGQVRTEIRTPREAIAAMARAGLGDQARERHLEHRLLSTDAGRTRPDTQQP